MKKKLKNVLFPFLFRVFFFFVFFFFSAANFKLFKRKLSFGLIPKIFTILKKKKKIGPDVISPAFQS